jgi:hypothetical protein
MMLDDRISDTNRPIDDTNTASAARSTTRTSASTR